MNVSFQNVYALDLMPSVVVLRDGAFGKYIRRSPEKRGPYNKISTFVRRCTGEFILFVSISVCLLLFHCLFPLPHPYLHTSDIWKHGKKEAVCNWRREASPNSPYWHPDLRLWSSGTLRRLISMFKPISLWHFIMALIDSGCPRKLYKALTAILFSFVSVCLQQTKLEGRDHFPSGTKRKLAYHLLYSSMFPKLRIPQL